MSERLFNQPGNDREFDAPEVIPVPGLETGGTFGRSVFTGLLLVGLIATEVWVLFGGRNQNSVSVASLAPATPPLPAPAPREPQVETTAKSVAGAPPPYGSLYDSSTAPASPTLSSAKPTQNASAPRAAAAPTPAARVKPSPYADVTETMSILESASP